MSKLAFDPHLPAYHLSFGAWQNDPNGLFRDESTGLLHLFAQFNANFSQDPGRMSWAHAISRDAVHWTTLPVALAPDEPYDCGGVFTGSATLVEGVPTLVYSVKCNRAVALAVPANRSDPQLTRWQKLAINPVISHEPGYNFRDPASSYRSPTGKGDWRLAIGCSGRICLYRSADFRSWRDAGVVYSVAGEHMWECPDSFPLPSDSTEEGDEDGGKEGTPWVMKVGLQAWDVYTVGRYRWAAGGGSSNDTFVPVPGSAALGWRGAFAHGQLVDWGNLYATKSFWDGVGKRRLLFGWIQEEPTPVRPLQAWQGVMSLPRVVERDPRNASRLVFTPAAEVSLLRIGPAIRLSGRELCASCTMPLVANESQLDVILQLRLPPPTFTRRAVPTQTFEVGASILATGGNLSSGLNVTVQVDAEVVDGRRSARIRVAGGPQKPARPKAQAPGREHVANMVADPCAPVVEGGLGMTGDFCGRFSVYPDESVLTLRLLADRSVVEAFAQGGRACVTKRIYPEAGAAARGLQTAILNAGTAPVRVEVASAWVMGTSIDRTAMKA